jgi:myo-inositol-1(or 4)-monophosphatase
MAIDYTKDAAIEIAKKAGEIAKKYFASKDLSTTAKSDMDFLTQADQEVDDFIRTAIKEHFPDAQLLTEETASDDASLITDVANLWIVDPIDGTTNFSRSDEHFAISIGLVDYGIPRLGVVYLPLENRLYIAAKNDEHATCNGEKIAVSTTSDLKKASIAYDWSWDLEKRKEMMEVLNKMYLEVRQPRSLGSAAAELCMVADGRLDGYINYGLKPWDIAAGMLIAEKAGAVLRPLDQEKMTVFAQDIVAVTPSIADKITHLTKR